MRKTIYNKDECTLQEVITSDEKIIMYDSDEAAQWRSERISGWFDRFGICHGDTKDGEHWARVAGCTHRRCYCGNVVQRYQRICDSCRARQDRKIYLELPKKTWNGETPIYSRLFDKYFSCVDELHDYIEDNHMEDTPFSDIAEYLQLVHCDPLHLSEVSEDYWHDEIPDEGELPEKIISALNNLNAVIGEYGHVSWSPGKYAVEL